MGRSILYIRIDAFCALVERGRRPELVSRSVIVGRSKGNTSGVVVSASKEAAKFGVEEGMSLRQAQRTCPNAVVVTADFALYRQVDRQFLDILAQYSPLLEPDSLGSAYMDVTGSRTLFGEASDIAARIKAQVFERLGLPVSIGCAANRLLAKVASLRGSFTCIAAGSESKFLAPLSVRVLDSVNPKIEKRLKELGVTTIGQLAMIPEQLLVRQFGAFGSAMRRQSLGMDAAQVKAAYPADIIKAERMFENAIEEPPEIEEHLREMVSEALAALRRRGSLAGEISLGIEIAGCKPAKSGPGLQTPDHQHRKPAKRGPGLQTPDHRTPDHRTPDHRREFNMQHCFKKPTDSPSAVIQAVAKMLMEMMQPGMEVSGVRVVLSGLTAGAASQLCLIGDGERKNRLDRTLELINGRFGNGKICFASTVAPGGRAGVIRRIAA